MIQLTRYIFLLIIFILFFSCNINNQDNEVKFNKQIESGHSMLDSKIKKFVLKNNIWISAEEYYKRFGVEDINQIIINYRNIGFDDEHIYYALHSMRIILSDIEAEKISHELIVENYKPGKGMNSYFKGNYSFTENEIKLIKNYSIKIYKSIE